MKIPKLMAIALASAAGLQLAACGQKGPLYLPDQGGEVVTRPGGQTQSTPSTETAPQPSTQTPPQTNPEEQKKDEQQTPR
ncbi:MAG TPA: lipoprotein [Steroidobacteraceae bacterium]|jgi:predicted small lipoprotein YifL|nr:lipoprotein [Steroidobacteraceae bacterium]